MAENRDRRLENPAKTPPRNADAIPPGLVHDDAGTSPTQTPQQESYGPYISAILEGPIHLTALDGAAEDEVMIAPTVVGAGTARLQGAAEVGKRETSHTVGDPHFEGRVVAGGERFGDLPEKIPMLPALRSVGVKSPEVSEEYLAIQTGGGPQFDDFGHLLELIAQARAGKDRADGGVALAEHRVQVEGIFTHRVGRLDQGESAIEFE